MNKRIIIIFLVVVIFSSCFYSILQEEKKAERKFLGDNFTPEIKWEVQQLGNNSALLHLEIELPPEKNLKAEIRGIENVFYRKHLYIRTGDSPYFVRNEKGVENYLIVPNGEILTVRIKLSVMVDEGKKWWTVSLKDKTIEVIT